MSDPTPRTHATPIDPQQPPPPGDPRKGVSPLLWIAILVLILACGWYVYDQRGAVAPAMETTAPAVDIGSEQESAGEREHTAAEPAQAASAAHADRPAMPVARMRPSYPPTAFRAKKEGTVLLRVAVDAQGYVSGVDVVRPSVSPELDRAAISAMHEWTFEPAIKGGQPIASMVEVPVEFKLDSP